MNKLLHVKPYVLFLIFILPMPIYTYQFFTIPQPLSPSLYIFQELVSFTCSIILLLWYYASGKELYSKVKGDTTLSIRFFKICYYVNLIFLIISYSIDILGISHYELFNSTLFLIGYFALVLFAVLFSFYILMFLAKALVSTETDDDSTFSYYFSEFFAILFFPIGVWWIQPRIQKIFEIRDSS